ncbi:EF-hand domain-containing protein [Phenylobacterium aquaticum]|uniref:EF-hand domain-containing protein n=1 Tax=Phenylobacterium aquaticum TaxID=1763816 RepID=UPI0026EB5DDF|nr:EF-hand domain-containing protein [Phenylobacterium aquaticum]
MKRLLIAAGFMLVAGVAQAERGAPNGGGMMHGGGGPRQDPDLNHDGKVTFAEFKTAAADRMLRRLDTNKDGRISKAEVKAMIDRRAGFGPPDAAQRMQARFAKQDANHDGFLTRAEIEAGARKRFDEADTNHDGWLSRDEMLILRQNRRGPG